MRSALIGVSALIIAVGAACGRSEAPKPETTSTAPAPPAWNPTVQPVALPVGARAVEPQINTAGPKPIMSWLEQTDETAGEWLLSSTGRSSYRDVDVGVKFTHGTSADLNVSYARSMARGDLNTLTNFFGAVMWPVIGANAYAPAASDVPNRLLARGRVNPTPRWLLLGILDWRSGLPYSVTNDTLDFVGARNSQRFPTYLRLEVGIERRLKVLKFQPWVGVRVWNALDSFLPTDVQANLGSPAFGRFYNSEYRQFRIQVRFER